MKTAIRIAKKNLETSMMGRSFPKCFESLEQYEEWLEQESIANTKNFRKDICEDCTLPYKIAQMAMGRCVNWQRTIKEEKISTKSVGYAK
jgi:hypothetical protein